MGSSRRAARAVSVAPEATDPKRVTQELFETPYGDARAWFKGGACYRVQLNGITYGRRMAVAVWATVLDGSFRPNDFLKFE